MTGRILFTVHLRRPRELATALPFPKKTWCEAGPWLVYAVQLKVPGSSCHLTANNSYVTLLVYEGAKQDRTISNYHTTCFNTGPCPILLQ